MQPGLETCKLKSSPSISGLSSFSYFRFFLGATLSSRLQVLNYLPRFSCIPIYFYEWQLYPDWSTHRLILHLDRYKIRIRKEDP